MSKPTPAPWKWDGEPGKSDLRHAGEPGDVDGCVIRYETYEGMWFADYGTKSRDKANARLVAAAPDLLAALKLCAAVCAGETSDKNGLIRALEMARDAIRKAEAK